MINKLEIGLIILIGVLIIKFISSKGNYSLDADGFLWGTEIYLTILDNPDDKKEIDAINNTLKTKNLKVRIDVAGAKPFSNIVYLPSKEKPEKVYDLDEFVKIFKENNWSMRPMFTLPLGDPVYVYTDSDIDDYVNYIDWFVTRYKNDANIKYIELMNTPIILLMETGPYDSSKITLKQLLDTQNKVYNLIKNKYSDILIGTHGFEYMFDENTVVVESMVEMVEYFLDKSNGAKFDYWAFHGYGTYPSPVQTPTYNKYSAISGILEIRKKLDANGWQDRLIIDTEHVPSMSRPLSDDSDKADAAATLQELIIKRTLNYNNTLVLSGITPLKIITRGDFGEHGCGSLKEDGSLSRTIKATALLWSKLNEYNHISHMSGEFNEPDQGWIEKFQSGKKELYIFFKPILNPDIMDEEILNYDLDLTKLPTSITLTDINGNIESLTPSQTITLEAVNSPKFLEVGYGV